MKILAAKFFHTLHHLEREILCNRLINGQEGTGRDSKFPISTNIKILREI